MSDHNPLSGKALAAGVISHDTKALAAGSAANDPQPPLTLFITWTTYGSWLPGDSRGWRKWRSGQRLPQPLLEDWCRERMKEPPVVLHWEHREAVENVCREHAQLRGWALHAISVRSNHVHIAVTAFGIPAKVRDQFKANGTRVLRQLSNPIANEKIWTKGGDVEFLDTEDDLQQVVLYITVAQDRMDYRE